METFLILNILYYFFMGMLGGIFLCISIELEYPNKYSKKEMLGILSINTLLGWLGLIICLFIMVSLIASNKEIK